MGIMWSRRGEVPLPKEVIDLGIIKDLDFFSIGFREWVSIYGEWVITVYPFVVSIRSIWKEEGILLTFSEYNFVNSNRHHHIDYKEGQCDYDPCDMSSEIHSQHSKIGETYRYLS